MGPPLAPITAVAWMLTPPVIAVWLALSACLAVVSTRQREPKRLWLVEFALFAANLALSCLPFAIIWQQATGAFIPFSQAWPSAFAISFLWGIFAALALTRKERVSGRWRLAIFALTTIMMGALFLVFFFVFPKILRWELELLGFI